MLMDASQPATRPDHGARRRTAVAVIGGGAIGAYLAAAAEDAGHDVTVCVRSPLDQLEITRDGKRHVLKARIVTDPAGARPAPWVVVATKAQDAGGAATWLKRLVVPDTVVVAAQNGVGHEERLRPLVGRAVVVPALIYAAVERVAPGRIVLHTGERIVVPQGAPGAAFARLLAGSGIAVVEDADFLTASWRKLLSNIASNPVTALTMRRVGVMREPAIRELVRGLLREAVAAGRAEGAKLSERDIEDVLVLLTRFNPSGGSSMLYDRLAGRPLEHQHLTGAVVRAAERHGIAVPLNQTILTLLEALDTGLRGADHAR